MVNSKSKGGKAERLIAAIFTKWWGGDFFRKPNMTKGSDHRTPRDFPYAVEVKDRVVIRACHFFSPTEKLKDQWVQTAEQAVSEKKRPLLITKADKSWYAMFQEPRISHALPVHIDGDWVQVATLENFMKEIEAIRRL